MGLYDAVPVPMMEPREVVKYLRDRLPQFASLLGGPENFVEPYSSSGLLAEEMLRRQDDSELLQSLCSVMNEMALSREYWMQETLGDLLEGLIHDEAFVAKLRPHLNAQAKEKLEAATG
jgi:hypothetical protein